MQGGVGRRLGKLLTLEDFDRGGSPVEPFEQGFRLLQPVTDIQDSPSRLECRLLRVGVHATARKCLQHPQPFSHGLNSAFELTKALFKLFRRGRKMVHRSLTPSGMVPR